MRRMMFGTFLIPGSCQWIELAHACSSPCLSGVVSVQATAFDSRGVEVASQPLPVHERIVDLQSLCPPRDEGLMVLTDVGFEMEGRDHPYQYGFLYQGNEKAAPIHYPLGIVLGLTNLVHFSNTAYFPLSVLPSWMAVRLFVGNPSRHAAIDIEIAAVSHTGVAVHPVRLPPLAHQVVELDDVAGGGDVDYLMVRGPVKSLAFVAGVHRETGAVTFLEHLIETNPTTGVSERSIPEEAVVSASAPERAADRASVPVNDPGSMLCYCLHLTYGDVAKMWRRGSVKSPSSTRIGSYCTSCRGDLEWFLARLARRETKAPSSDERASPADGDA